MHGYRAQQRSPVGPRVLTILTQLIIILQRFLCHHQTCTQPTLSPNVVLAPRSSAYNWNTSARSCCQGCICLTMSNRDQGIFTTSTPTGRAARSHSDSLVYGRWVTTGAGVESKAIRSDGCRRGTIRGYSSQALAGTREIGPRLVD
ncbi:hypothetical protein EDB84DRAFT_1154071 [Lactarius hengduanensis]|nr:hypothetical protein EDB84DRAFT_1154071 [Lactarius hengduanensis]